MNTFFQKLFGVQKRTSSLIASCGHATTHTIHLDLGDGQKVPYTWKLRPNEVPVMCQECYQNKIYKMIEEAGLQQGRLGKLLFLKQMHEE